jgi:hypothetical protein
LDEKGRIALKATQLPEDEARLALATVGLTQVEFKYDENGVMEITASGESPSPEDVQFDLDHEWKKSMKSIIDDINGSEAEYCDLDIEMISDFEQEYDGL